MTLNTVDEAAPGHPGEILRVSRRLDHISCQLNDSHVRLKGVIDGVESSSDIFSGSLATAFADSFEDLPADLRHVSDAIGSLSAELASWGHGLQTLRDEAQSALNSYHNAEQAEESASCDHEQARQRLSSLRSSVRQAEHAEKIHLQAHRRAAATGDVHVARSEYDNYIRSFRQKQDLTNSAWDAEYLVDRLQTQIDTVRREKASAQARLVGIKDRHTRLDSQIADAIESAVPKQIRDRNFFEKAWNAAVDRFNDFFEFVDKIADIVSDMVDAVVDGDLGRALARFRQLIVELQVVVDVLATIAKVVLVIAAIAVSIVGTPAAGAALLGVGMFVISAAEASYAALRFNVTSLTFALNVEDPDNPGTPAVTAADVFSDLFRLGFAAADVAISGLTMGAGNIATTGAKTVGKELVKDVGIKQTFKFMMDNFEDIHSAVMPVIKPGVRFLTDALIDDPEIADDVADAFDMVIDPVGWWKDTQIDLPYRLERVVDRYESGDGFGAAVELINPIPDVEDEVPRQLPLWTPPEDTKIDNFFWLRPDGPHGGYVSQYPDQEFDQGPNTTQQERELICTRPSGS